MSYTVEAKWTRNKNKDCLAIGGDLNINLLKRMRKHPRSLDFKYGVLSRGSSLPRKTINVNSSLHDS